MKNRRLISIKLGPMAMSMLIAAAVSPAFAEEVDFNRDVRPILSDKCFRCHGPDDSSREADLRLDEREGAVADLGGYAVVVPGNPDASEMILRMTADDEDLVMPPPDMKKPLTADEIEILRSWIEQGAPYAGHWAFEAPQRPALPELSEHGQTWVRNPIDYFVFARMERAGLSPSPIADRITLLRRLHLDLTGLPPSLKEADRFERGGKGQSYEKRVKELLASPHYGERWARHWLDAARFADSDGYEKDKQRSVWFWRDWVIQALNADKPYDRFVIEQIAGDLLPEAGQDELVATGFLRNSMVNEEGGADPEQFRVEGIFDRMDAIGKAILGLTTQCAQCHTHKYDPLSHSEYYGMFAFLNGVEEATATVYTKPEQEHQASLYRRIRSIEDELKASRDPWQKEMIDWASEVAVDQPVWTVIKPTKMPYEGQKFRLLDDDSIISESYAPTRNTAEFQAIVDTDQITGIRLEVLTHPQLPRGGPGRSIYGTGALTEFAVYVEPTDGSIERSKIKLAEATADVNPSHTEIGYPYRDTRKKEGDDRVTGRIEYAIDDDPKTAWTTDSGPATRNQPRKAVFVAETPFGFASGATISFVMVQNHGGWNSDDNQNNLLGRYRFSITTDPAPQADPLPQHVRELVKKSADQWTDDERDIVFGFWRTTIPAWQKENSEIERLYAQMPEGSSQLVVLERERKRPSHVLNRGDFLNLGPVAEPDVPAFLHPFPEGADRDRLGFALWLVDRRSPTTARTIVNRIWQAYFGTGLVETPEDLGSQSPPPSHPALLDWLAVELMESNWSLKHLHELIVNSATYRQSSNVSEELESIDPRNRLLARGARIRVEAEIVRDIALKASGLLNDAVGGPSVYPPAPDFLFQPPASYGPKNWNTSSEGEQYRRGLYVHAYRSVQYPPLQVFDAPKGDAACVRRVRSNTPLQALTLLNETQFVQFARALGERVLRESSRDDDERIEYAFRLCVTRKPTQGEVIVLRDLLEKSRDHYQQSPDLVTELLSNGTQQEKVPAGVAATELAAWTIVSRALLNLDETITKQ